MQQTSAPQFKLSQRLTPHLVNDELFELSTRIQRRMKNFGVLHTVNFVQATPRDMYEIAYAMQQLLQLLEDEEPKLRQDIEIQKKKSQESEARAVRYQKEAFQMQCRVEELQHELAQANKKHKAESQLLQSQVSQAQTNEDIFRKKLRQEQRELERIKALSSKQQTELSKDSGKQDAKQFTQIQKSLIEPQKILKQPHMVMGGQENLNKSVSFADTTLNYQPKNPMDVVKSKTLQKQIYFGEEHNKMAALSAENITADHLQSQFSQNQFNPGIIGEEFGQNSQPLSQDVRIQQYVQYNNNQRNNPSYQPVTYSYPQQNQYSNQTDEQAIQAAQLPIDFTLPPVNLQSSSQQDQLNSSKVKTPKFNVHLNYGQPNGLKSLLEKSKQESGSNFTSTASLPYAEISGVREARKQLSQQQKQLDQVQQPNTSQQQLSFPQNDQSTYVPQEIAYQNQRITVPTIPVTIIATKPNFEESRAQIDYIQLLKQSKQELTDIAQDRRVIDAARAQVQVEEQRISQQKSAIQQALAKLESSGVDVKALVSDML